MPTKMFLNSYSLTLRRFESIEKVRLHNNGFVLELADLLTRVFYVDFAKLMRVATNTKSSSAVGYSFYCF